MVIEGFRIPQAKISRIPQSGFPYMGLNLSQLTLHPLLTSESVKLKAKCGAVVELG